MQAKLDEVTSNSAGACDEFLKKIDHATRELVQLVGDKVCASEAHALGTVDQKVTTLEKKMHHNLEAAMAAAECRAAGRLEDMEARISENIRSMEHRVQGEMQTKFDSNISTMELRLNNLLRSSSTHLSDATSNKIAESEARTIMHQQELHQKARVAHTDALAQVESRMMQHIRASRDIDSAKLKAALENIDHKFAS